MFIGRQPKVSLPQEKGRRLPSRKWVCRRTCCQMIGAKERWMFLSKEKLSLGTSKHLWRWYSYSVLPCPIRSRTGHSVFGLSPTLIWKIRSVREWWNDFMDHSGTLWRDFRLSVELTFLKGIRSGTWVSMKVVCCCIFGSWINDVAFDQ